MVDGNSIGVLQMVRNLLADGQGLNPLERDALLCALNELLAATCNLSTQLDLLDERIARPKSGLYLVK